MFNKTNNNYEDLSKNLVFLKSSSVKAFPSGRRRSELISADINNDDKKDETEGYYIPFDPEARLNTEANSRKYSSLNGFTQTYLKKWDSGSDEEVRSRDGQLLLSLGGYLFDINLDVAELKTPAEFGDKIIKSLLSKITEDAAAAMREAINSADAIYANIILEDVLLYSSSNNFEYYTSILRDQLNADSDLPRTSLDLLKEDSNSHAFIAEPSNYYFSGLSFSVSPLTSRAVSDPDTYIAKTRDEQSRTVNHNETNYAQHLISLRILEKVEGVWQIHQPAFLPEIRHDDTVNSVVLGDTRIERTIVTNENGTEVVVQGSNGNLEVENSLTVHGITEIDGDTTIKSNLYVNDNINVGAPANPAIEDNGGYIVAEKDITAEQDLVAKKDLRVDEKATIENLVVGIRDANDSTASGVITAKNYIKAPVLEAENELNVSNDAGDAQANIDNATITNATITEELKVQNNNSNAKLTTDTAEITGDLTVVGTIKAETDLSEDAPNLVVNKAAVETADINTLTGTSATITDITGSSTVNSPNIYQNGYKVPIIELSEPDTDGFYQLKITRIGTKS